jgi:hypothetical protein
LNLNRWSVAGPKTEMSVTQRCAEGFNSGVKGLIPVLLGSHVPMGTLFLKRHNPFESLRMKEFFYAVEKREDLEFLNFKFYEPFHYLSREMQNKSSNFPGPYESTHSPTYSA